MLKPWSTPEIRKTWATQLVIGLICIVSVGAVVIWSFKVNLLWGSTLTVLAICVLVYAVNLRLAIRLKVSGILIAGFALVMIGWVAFFFQSLNFELSELSDLTSLVLGEALLGIALFGFFGGAVAIFYYWYRREREVR
jgi:hypothetical protein